MTMTDKKPEEKKEEKKAAGPSNNGPLFDYRRDVPCD